MRKFTLFLLLLITNTLAANPKVLHLTFHRGCANEIAGVAKKLDLSLDTWYIPDLPPNFFDGESSGLSLYNIGHEMAKRVWDIHKNTFSQYDVIITSDTAPLSRIFLQNNFSKPLIIWISNRFDYYDGASLNCDFPDQEYYDLFNKATTLPNVTVVANTAFEHLYTLSKGVISGFHIIKPCGFYENLEEETPPSHEDRNNTIYIPCYHNEQIFMDLSSHLTNMGIQNYRGRHNGSNDLKHYKAIVHLPYAWLTFALFENIKIGIPYFIPSKTFIEKLYSTGNYWHQNACFLFEEKLYEISEWYDPQHKDIFIYFDSWEDLQHKIATLDYEKQRKIILEYSKKLQKETLKDWQSVFESTNYNQHQSTSE
jgi:hypothetical protein